ncbi:MAG: efflux RND transporter periplasmic adaptor subunit [Betaproteobacteria bacterium]|nr:efflux RND transporter periplasmic adaptor subunit [Betaproteobacteria bacterium]
MSKHAAVILIVCAALALSACDRFGGSQENQNAEAATGVPPKDEHGHEKSEGDAHAKEKGREEGGLKLSNEQIAAAGIKVEAIEEQEVSDHVSVTATIHANMDRLARVTPRVPGRIVRVQANIGDRVAAGQVLAQLDSPEIGEAFSAYWQAQTEHKLAQSSFERAQRLYTEQIVPQKEFLRAQGELEKAATSLRAAREKLRLLGISPGSALGKEAASVFAVTAPFAGTIIEKAAVLGELSQPDKALFTVADLSTVWIEGSVFEKDLAKVRVGAPAEITVTAFPGEVFKGKVAYLSSVMDKETRTLKARIDVPNKDRRLIPEMFATALIQTGGAAKAILVPEEAIVLIQGVSTVFVEDAHGFEPRPVDPGEKLNGRVVLKNGIKPGDLVVVAGTYALKARMLKSQIGEGHAH